MPEGHRSSVGHSGAVRAFETQSPFIGDSQKKAARLDVLPLSSLAEEASGWSFSGDLGHRCRPAPSATCGSFPSSSKRRSSVEVPHSPFFKCFLLLLSAFCRKCFLLFLHAPAPVGRDTVMVGFCGRCFLLRHSQSCVSEGCAKFLLALPVNVGLSQLGFLLRCTVTVCARFTLD